MDLKELVNITTAQAHSRQFLKDLTDAFANFSKPTIAAVLGFAVSQQVQASLVPPRHT
jgi:enoyl-CoA hydratase